MIRYPDIDPVFIHYPFPIRWYGISYLAGVLLSLLYIRLVFSEHFKDLKKCVEYIIIGIIVGGRLGEVLFYDTKFFLEDPMRILRIWEPGMSFHGGFIGTVLAVRYYCYKHKKDPGIMCNLVAMCGPIGIFFGRIANFVNDELWGKVTDVPWAVGFPSGGFLPRHPSQIYEALTEGLFLWIVLFCMRRQIVVKYRLCGIFCVLYGIARFVTEYWREPNWMFLSFSSGQWLSIPLFIGGLIVLAQRSAQ